MAIIFKIKNSIIYTNWNY